MSYERKIIERLEADIRELRANCERSEEVSSQTILRLLKENQDLRERLDPGTLEYRQQQLEGRDDV